MFARRIDLVRSATAVVGAVLALILLSPSAVAADREEVSFSVIAFGIESQVTERGPNHSVIDWTFVTAEFGDFSGPDLRFGHPGFRLTWDWNEKTGSGRVSGTLSTTHFFDPVHWEGEFWGRMTETGGEGTLHMTEVNTGQKLRATWTLPPINPLDDVFGFVFEATGTVSV
jgi:hypothetical protein